MMLLPIILIILLFVILNHSSRRKNIGFTKDKNNALDILDRRFANGEINEEEYLKKSSILKER